MSQKLPLNFDCIKNTSQINEDFMKNYDEESDEGYFIEFDVEYLRKLHKINNGLPSLPKIIKFKKSKSIKSWISFEKSS